MVDKWAKRSSREDTHSRLAFLNRHRQKFYWGNDILDNSEGLVEDSCPEVLTQMLGIDLEAEQDIHFGIIKILGRREEELASWASNNNGMEPEIPTGGAGVS